MFRSHGTGISEQSGRAVVGDEGKVEKAIHVLVLFGFPFIFSKSCHVTKASGELGILPFSPPRPGIADMHHHSWQKNLGLA